jgi:hypothetical protein
MIFHSARKYEDTGPEKVPRDAARRHAHQSDPAEKWRAKVISLVPATTVWYRIKKT